MISMPRRRQAVYLVFRIVSGLVIGSLLVLGEDWPTLARNAHSVECYWWLLTALCKLWDTTCPYALCAGSMWKSSTMLAQVGVVQQLSTIIMTASGCGWTGRYLHLRRQPIGWNWDVEGHLCRLCFGCFLMPGSWVLVQYLVIWSYWLFGDHSVENRISWSEPNKNNKMTNNNQNYRKYQDKTYPPEKKNQHKYRESDKI